MHRTRLIVALVFLPVFFLIVKYLPPFFFLFLVMIVALLGQFEFLRFFYSDPFPPVAYLGLFMGFLTPLGFYFSDLLYMPLFLVAVLASVLVFQLFFFKNIKNVFVETGVVILGVFYVSWLLSHLILLRGFPDGELIIFFLLLVTWAGDSGAYYIGKLLGNKKLYETVSPGKTVAGSVGGLLCSLGVTFLGKTLFFPSLSNVDCLTLGILLGVLGQLGDLTESLFKRSAGKKDSSGIIPAHGGILDKVDSLLFTAPVFYYFLLLVKGYGKGFNPL